VKNDDLAFMQQIRDWFLSQQSNQFLLTGNVHDVFRCPWLKRADALSERNYKTLADYLTERLAMKRRLVITYNIARGIRFARPEDRESAREVYLSLFTDKEQALGAESFDDVVTKSSVYVFPSLVFLRKLCEASTRLPKGRGVPIAVIVDHVPSVLPNNPITQMGDADRQRLIFFKEWLTEPEFVASDHLLILVSETASAVNESIRSLPHLINVNVPLPDEGERKRFIRWRLHTKTGLKLAGSQSSFARLSAGMTLLGIEQTMRLAQYKKGSLDRDDFLYFLNRLLTSRIGDYVELVRPGHSLQAVIGNAALKAQLRRLTKALRSGDPDIAPVGLLITGPNGVGKTYIAMAWAREGGRIVLVLKNLRSSYFGETDQIFEKIRNVLEVLGNVTIIVDEADTVFAAPGRNTHETEQRLFGNVIKMMGDPKNRSRIVWVLMTARPDNLAADLKRSGRCGLHLPVFDPEGEDRVAFIDFVLSESGLSLSAFGKPERDRFMELTKDYSPADFRELTVELRTEALVRGEELTAAGVLDVLADYVPGSISRQRRLQTLQALLHCSRRSLAPPSLRAMTKAEIAREIAKLTAGAEA